MLHFTNKEWITCVIVFLTLHHITDAQRCNIYVTLQCKKKKKNAYSLIQMSQRFIIDGFFCFFSRVSQLYSTEVIHILRDNSSAACREQAWWTLTPLKLLFCYLVLLWLLLFFFIPPGDLEGFFFFSSLNTEWGEHFSRRSRCMPAQTT